MSGTLQVLWGINTLKPSFYVTNSQIVAGEIEVWTEITDSLGTTKVTGDRIGYTIGANSSITYGGSIDKLAIQNGTVIGTTYNITARVKDMASGKVISRTFNAIDGMLVQIVSPELSISIGNLALTAT